MTLDTDDRHTLVAAPLSPVVHVDDMHNSQSRVAKLEAEAISFSRPVRLASTDNLRYEEGARATAPGDPCCALVLHDRTFQAASFSSSHLGRQAPQYASCVS